MSYTYNELYHFYWNEGIFTKYIIDVPRVYVKILLAYKKFSILPTY